MFKGSINADRFHCDKVNAGKATDEKIETVLLWLLYALIIMFICCQHSWLVSTIECYMFDFIPMIITRGTNFIYGSIDCVAPIFIVVWYFGQVGNVKMNLSSNKRTMGIANLGDSNKELHRYASSLM